ncbi:glucose dehydrogenase [FAD, quinone]-like [Leptopilina heterotoma]|uniref:glucose dehydrogenase [FAD, quinone]-like n=1 Tax=Leptopilina heterotoma TaxID=63436 RepID=UPI001CA94B15|nr:glucose dehydrogenase [FAD, quinone]-like [Leptopilina heterotoma]XP_043485315.1 glucose dehydrogenase [FAD, quinone]-like [Leptopilina heterotoma]XP_043485325.1 glucose dehydrogenase [FAD, quinone]-like [Leptopilina heterotoma]
MNCNAVCPLASNNFSGTSLASACGGGAFILFMGILEQFIRKKCDLEDPCRRVSSKNIPNNSYDFIVIGGGSAGAVVASRLSEEECFSVLLLEAGLDEPAWSQVPSFFFNYLHTDMDWQYTTESEENACLNKKDSKCYWGRGKVLGGTSVMNGMMYMRGSRKDYDNWEKLGNKGWSYRDVLKYFMKSENNLQLDKVDAGYHSRGGPLAVTQFNHHFPISYDILNAGKELGYNTGDLNGRNHTGFMIAQTNSLQGSRFSSARAFVRPARNRKNFHVMLNSTVTKIIFDNNKKAVAVEFYKNGKLNKVGVNKEVVVSGGAVNSPQILLNSGIGAKKELEKVNVPVVNDLPGVGENLHNHVSYGLSFTIDEPNNNTLNWATAMEYLTEGRGPMSGTGISEATGMINTKYANPNEDHPDIQLIFGGYLAACSETGAINENSESPRNINIYPTVLHPKSKGYLRLRNNDPLSKPMISPKYFSHSDDIGALTEGIKFAIRLTETNALKKYNIKLDKTPVEGCENFEFGTDAYWKCAVTRDTNAENHQAGSCKMGPDTDPMAVVDNELKVKGVSGVRVADTSIMPDVISGNTHAPAVMIGERAADFIKNCWNSYRNQCKQYHNGYVHDHYYHYQHHHFEHFQQPPHYYDI